MAPSVRSASTRTRKAQPSLLGYAKVTKFSTVGRGRKSVKLTIENVETLLSPTVEESNEPVVDDKKRKRGIYASEAEESETEELPVKKVLSTQTPVD